MCPLSLLISNPVLSAKTFEQWTVVQLTLNIPRHHPNPRLLRGRHHPRNLHDRSPRSFILSLCARGCLAWCRRRQGRCHIPSKL